MEEASLRPTPSCSSRTTTRSTSTGWRPGPATSWTPGGGSRVRTWSGCRWTSSSPAEPGSSAPTSAPRCAAGGWPGDWSPRRPLDRPRLQPLRRRRRARSRARSSTPTLVGRLVGGVDAVVHLAAVPAVARSLKDPRASHEANATGTVVVLEAARAKGAQVLVASSSSVYGRGVTMPTPEDHPTRPASPYAASKLATEAYALSFARSFGLPVLALRFFNVFGPHQRADHAYAAVIPAFVSRCAVRPPARRPRRRHPDARLHLRRRRGRRRLRGPGAAGHLRRPGEPGLRDEHLAPRAGGAHGGARRTPAGADQRAAASGRRPRLPGRLDQVALTLPGPSAHAVARRPARHHGVVRPSGAARPRP